MTDVLADTSIWIAHLRPGSAFTALDRPLADRRVVTCGAVAAELLTGARGDTATVLRSRLRGLRWIALEEPADWFDAGELRAVSAARGQPVALVDTLLAVLALRTRAQLWTLDRDFEQIAGVAPGLDLRMLA
ncbi:MAG: PIN domain-containing protein [Solirubrobacterales bacterium]|nr:PIN domain-containing protein [Solirubrobacterales bacterium]